MDLLKAQKDFLRIVENGEPSEVNMYAEGSIINEDHMHLAIEKHLKEVSSQTRFEKEGRATQVLKILIDRAESQLLITVRDKLPEDSSARVLINDKLKGLEEPAHILDKAASKKFEVSAAKDSKETSNGNGHTKTKIDRPKTNGEVLTDDITNQNLHTIYAKPEVITAEHLIMAKKIYHIAVNSRMNRNCDNTSLHRAVSDGLEVAEEMYKLLLGKARPSLLEEISRNNKYVKVPELQEDARKELQSRKDKGVKPDFISRLKSVTGFKRGTQAEAYSGAGR